MDPQRTGDFRELVDARSRHIEGAVPATSEFVASGSRATPDHRAERETLGVRGDKGFWKDNQLGTLRTGLVASKATLSRVLCRPRARPMPLGPQQPAQQSPKHSGRISARQEETRFRRPAAGKWAWSGRRDSNPRHPAWKASALPTELLPLAVESGCIRLLQTVPASHCQPSAAKFAAQYKGARTSSNSHCRYRRRLAGHPLAAPAEVLEWYKLGVARAPRSSELEVHEPYCKMAPDRWWAHAPDQQRHDLPYSCGASRRSSRSTDV